MKSQPSNPAAKQIFDKQAFWKTKFCAILLLRAFYTIPLSDLRS